MIKHKALRVVAAVVFLTGVLGVVAIASGGAEPSAVRLHLGSDGQYFKVGTTTQTLTTAKNSCAITSAQTVMALSATGSQAVPGIAAESIGVKSRSGANGTPCSLVDATEALTLKPGTSISSRTFSGVRLDLEITGNAVVKLTLSRGTTSAVYQLQTGTSITAAQSSEPDYDTTVPYNASSSPGDTVDACAAPNSSGPNSGPNDNCEWTVQPGFNFDTVTLTTVSVGTVSLEGSSDFGNNPDYDSMFYLSNSAPTPTNDTITTNEDTAVSGNVLTNDSDPDGNPLSASLVSGPSHGTLSLLGTGAFTYTPAANYNGADSFTYAASDGTLSTNATASITVVSVDDPPVAVDDAAEVNQHESVDIPVLANDTDIDSTNLTPTNIGSITPGRRDRDGERRRHGALHRARQLHRAGIVHLQGVGRNAHVEHRNGERDRLPGDLQQRHRHRSGRQHHRELHPPRRQLQLQALHARRDRRPPTRILFQPTGGDLVDYRGFVSFGADSVVHAGPARRAEPELRPHRWQHVPARPVVRRPAVRRQPQRDRRDDPHRGDVVHRVGGDGRRRVRCPGDDVPGLRPRRPEVPLIRPAFAAAVLVS